MGLFSIFLGVAIGLVIRAFIIGWVIIVMAGMIWHETGMGVPFGMFPLGFILGLLTGGIHFLFFGNKLEGI